MLGVLGVSWGGPGSQNPPQDAPKSRPRRSKTVLKWKVVFRTPFWELPPRVFRRHFSDFGPSWASSWGQVGAKNRKKSIPKSIKILMLFKIDFGTDFDRFLDPTWSQVGIKIGSKIDVNFERRFFKNLALPPAGAQFFRIWGSKLGGKFNQKSMKNGSQNGMHLGIDF